MANNQNQFMPKAFVQPSRLGTVATVLGIGLALVAAVKMGGDAFGTHNWQRHK